MKSILCRFKPVHWDRSLKTHILCLLLFISGSLIQANENQTIDFSREILPLLSDACFQCHGPDPKARKGNLRLDVEESAKKHAENEMAVISPGDPLNSELIRRLTTEDEDDLMPPHKLGRPLNKAQIKLLEQWVTEGAKWGKHWSLNPIEKPSSPKPGKHSIDAFVEKALEKAGLIAQPKADRRTLIRRLALDLTGLPPTLEELNEILGDTTHTWFEKAIDRYLASPAYGERMAWNWLDAARYADSNGYQGDRERTMWPWRDWVVESFNDNLPWDTFTTWQLAGDLLPDATHEQKLATGFCRNHMINGEGGRIPEENRVDYVMDMTETMGTVWLGATLTCARCHDHKYDPYTRKEYYQLFDFFNQTPVTGGGGDPQTPPILSTPSPAQSMAINQAEMVVQRTQSEFYQFKDKHMQELEAWEAERLSQINALIKTEKEAEKESLKALQLALKTPDEKRTDKQKKTVMDAFITSVPELANARDQWIKAKDRLNKIKRSIPKVMVMEEISKRRQTPMLERGLYNQERDTVLAAVPASLPPLENFQNPPNRLNLAEWLMRRDHPLTARVTVNRFWQQFFGMGLVKTPEDFGVQGEFPKHLELLDWLSAEFMDSGWDVKQLIKIILSSQTYQRSSVATPKLIEADPENRLYARAPRFRLPSWMIRDQALAAAGLLDPSLGGAPVNGYQPDGVWEDATFGNKKYSQDHGKKLFRRSLYTFWRRIIAPTLLFDTASRQTCNVDAKRTNSPLHALATLNDTTFVEAARGLSIQAMSDELQDHEILERIYLLTLARPPSDQERSIWIQSADRARSYFSSDREAIDAWLSHGESDIPTGLNRMKLAAWTTVSLGILNMDETLTRE